MNEERSGKRREEERGEGRRRGEKEREERDGEREADRESEREREADRERESERAAMSDRQTKCLKPQEREQEGAVGTVVLGGQSSTACSQQHHSDATPGQSPPSPRWQTSASPSAARSSYREAGPDG